MNRKQQEIDIVEDSLVNKYPEVLNILLKDRTTNKNIFWATDNYESKGDYYKFSSPIKIELITGSGREIIMPRVLKNKILQNTRVKEKAEVYTPAWICNVQNNQIDNAWFQKKDVFNREIELSKNGFKWKTNFKKIVFPKNKSWEDYVKDIRLEIACGEAPYITSRYDAATGEFIPINERIGILDRKLRIINENVDTTIEWLKAAQIAFKSTYAYEWQGDSLLLAREAMLATFIENYISKFNKNPQLKSIQNIAEIISWNVWQMDGLKGVIPCSCIERKFGTTNLFNKKEIEILPCTGCIYNDITNHNGVYCLIKDWFNIDGKISKNGKEIRFIDLIQKKANN